MPYPRAYIYFAILLVAAMAAFMPTYFLRLDEAGPAHHFHAATAAAWLLMLISQSWAISHRRFALHRATGRGSYLLAPLFIASGVTIIHAMANGAGPFREMFASGLMLADAIAVAAFAGLYFAAIANRRSVQVHARCMTATVLLLISPVAARLLSFYLPGFMIESVEEFHRFPLNYHLGNGAALVAVLVLMARDRKSYGIRPPYLAVAVVIALQSAGFALAGDAAWWRAAMTALGGLPAALVAGTAFLAGVGLVATATRAGRPASSARPA